jgi:uncharacterized protein (DUF4415 family)
VEVDRGKIRRGMISNISESDVQVFVDFCKKELPLESAVIRDEYYYASLPLCVVDAVFSISANYSSTMHVVRRVCDYFSIPQIDTGRTANLSEQFSIDQFLDAFDSYGLEKMTIEVFQNRQRTSTTNGILKSESVFRFCNVLKEFGVNTFGDLYKILGNMDFESKIRQIPGQTSGISLRYFFMLIGDDSYIKPDRMIDRFIVSAIGKSLSADDSQKLITSSMKTLRLNFPQLSPRLIDNLIWSYQRSQSSNFKRGKQGEINPILVEKSEIRIRLDTDILDWFKNIADNQSGENYQTMINQVLRQFMTYNQSPFKK